jgi:hypothetical protein
MLDSISKRRLVLPKLVFVVGKAARMETHLVESVFQLRMEDMLCERAGIH